MSFTILVLVSIVFSLIKKVKHWEGKTRHYKNYKSYRFLVVFSIPVALIKHRNLYFMSVTNPFDVLNGHEFNTSNGFSLIS